MMKISRRNSAPNVRAGMAAAAALAVMAALALNACLDADGGPIDDPRAQRLFVAHDGVLAAWNLATHEQIPGEIQNLKGPTDMQALADGTLLLNLTDNNQVLIVDGATMLEKDRIPSSTLGGKRPVHSYLSPERGGKRYWISLNDGDGTGGNSALFIDVAPGSAGYLKAVGETALGKGHHKASFSSRKERVVISNLEDCQEVLAVFDYADPAHIQKLAALAPAQAGWNDSDRVCDQSYAQGAPPAPHGCATSKLSGKAYCNLTGSGDIVAVDVDGAPPAFSRIATHGSGGGYTKAHPDGRYIYTLQAGPREGDAYAPGAACQIGQLAVIDAGKDSVVSEVPLLYRGPGCADSLAKSDAASAEPAHLLFSADGRKLYVQLAGGWMVAEARVRRQLVLDLADPAHPVPLPAIAIGTSSGYHGEALSGDGALLLEANNLDGTITPIEAASATALPAFPVKANPRTLATWGPDAGPSHQTGPLE